MVLNLFFCAWTPNVDCLEVLALADDALRFMVGAAPRLKEDREMSGELLCELILGGESTLEKVFRDEGNSATGGRNGINEALRYSLPKGVSKA